jgi:hypothetical protein
MGVFSLSFIYPEDKKHFSSEIYFTQHLAISFPPLRRQLGGSGGGGSLVVVAARW